MILKNQLTDQCKAKLIIEGVEVYFERLPENGKWIIRAKIDYTSEANSPSLSENILSLDYVKIDSGYLKACPEDNYVILIQEMHDLFSFDFFKDAMQNYMSRYDFWKSVVEDMIKNEDVLFI